MASNMSENHLKDVSHVPKFDGSNFRECSYELRMILQQLGLLSILDARVGHPIPTESSATPSDDSDSDTTSERLLYVSKIDTKQKNKLDNIIQTLGTSLHEAFRPSQVQKLTGNLTNLKSESPFGNFNLDTSSSSAGCSDVCILGNVKKEYEPPGDVPDAAYGEALIQFREHIHRRVVNNESGQSWKSRSIEEFSGYIEEVWKCIGSANFNFNFATVVERITFDKLESEYKKTEQKLAEAYLESFASIKRNMIEEKGKTIRSAPVDEMSNAIRLASFEAKLRDQVMPTEQRLDVEVKEILKRKGREKWNLQFEELWKMNKLGQERNWNFSLKTSFNTLFNYEHHVESYKKKMREEINELFKSTNLNDSEWTEKDKNNKFVEMFARILLEVQQHFPPKDIPEEIKKVYLNSNVIKTRQIEMMVVAGDGQSHVDARTCDVT
ncbi:hypothetical protein DAPPUDRAFT_261750 [Daphnia pulex]|uniref:Uncharacterized protein n=1 Tax=Daphnia pulex TaxID=6669 RepID=E9HLL3_DAPPU|nr:hypothetical protein DAPPUDRAFT_261750 [Daphnia pulex]|eukprot:EFX67373.1 hypothetical protein DAPPUDRAFT_261750 [Daphnia pulex]